MHWIKLNIFLFTPQVKRLNERLNRSLALNLFYLFKIFCIIVFFSLSNAIQAKLPQQKRIIQHALGETVIYGKPVRIVSLMQGATDTLVALDIQPVGVVESWAEKPMYAYLRPHLKDVKYVGLETQPSLEDIALLKPDLIIASKFRNEKTYKILSQIAPTIMLSEVYEFKDTLTMVGKAVGKEQQANALLKQWNTRVSQTQQHLKQKYKQHWPLQISLIEVRDDHLRAYSPQSFSGQILAELSFKWSKLAANQQWALQKINNKESIPMLNADLFFVFMRENPTTLQNFKVWKSHALWKRLKAQQNQQIYEVNSVYWNLTGGILGANLVLDELTQVLKLDPNLNNSPLKVGSTQ